MGRLSSAVRLGTFAIILTAFAACSSIYRNHGYVPRDEDLALLVVGEDTQETVAEKVGRPSSAGLLNGTGWYYVGSRWEQYAWRAPKEIDRQVVAISFNEDGTVQNIERFGLERGRVIALSRRVTDSNIAGVGFIRQLLGNVGNFSAEQILGNN